MASMSLGLHTRQGLGCPCCFSRFTVCGGCRECGVRRLLLHNRHCTRGSAEQRMKRPSGSAYRAAASHQRTSTESVSDKACVACSVRSVPPLLPPSGVRATLVLADFLRHASAKAFFCRGARTAAPADQPSSSASSCSAVCSPLCCNYDYHKTACRRLSPSLVGTAVLVSATTAGEMPQKCNNFHAARASAKRTPYHRRINTLIVKEGSDQRYFIWRNRNIASKLRFRRLQDELHGAFPAAAKWKIHVSAPAHDQHVCSSALALAFPSRKAAAKGPLAACAPADTPLVAAISGSPATIFTAVREGPGVAAPCALLTTIYSAGSIMRHTTLRIEPRGCRGAGATPKEGDGAPALGLRCADREGKKAFRRPGMRARNQCSMSRAHHGDEFGDEQLRVSGGRPVDGRRCWRPGLHTGTGAAVSAYRSAQAGLVGSRRGEETTKRTRSSHFGSLRFLPLVPGVAGGSQHNDAPAERDCPAPVEDRDADWTPVPPQLPEGATESPVPGTEKVEISLPGGSALTAHSPDDESYAAVLQQKITEQSAGRVFDGDGINCVADFLLHFKAATDLSWAAALPLLGAAVRLTTLPFAISSERKRRLRAAYREEMAELRKTVEKEEAKGLVSPELQKARKRLNTFLKKHDLGISPLDPFHVFLVGLTIGLTTPAVRSIAGHQKDFPQFAAEHPAWVDSLALPDPTPLTAFAGTYGMLTLIMAGWLVSDKVAKIRPHQSPPRSPLITRFVQAVLTSCVIAYAGMYIPVGAMILLLPAAGTQAVFSRLFRITAVERILNLVPESVKPLHVVYAEALRSRAPELFQMWQRDSLKKHATAKEAHSQMLLLWRKGLPQDCLAPHRAASHAAATAGVRL